MVNFELGETDVKIKKNQHVTSVGQRKKSESLTGFEPMTSEAGWKLSSTSGWLMSALKEYGLFKAGHTFGVLAVSLVFGFSQVLEANLPSI